MASKSVSSTGRSAATGRFVRMAKKTKSSSVGTHTQYGTLSDIVTAVRSDSMESSAFLDKIVRDGISMKIAREKLPLIESMVSHDVFPRKTWEHARKSKRSTLTPANSERFIRVLRITEKANEAFGENTGRDWLETPMHVFDNRPPIEMLTTESGARAVELYLGRVMHGFNA